MSTTRWPSPSAISVSASWIATAVPASPFWSNDMLDRPPCAAIGGGCPSVRCSGGTSRRRPKQLNSTQPRRSLSIQEPPEPTRSCRSPQVGQRSFPTHCRGTATQNIRPTDRHAAAVSLVDYVDRTAGMKRMSAMPPRLAQAGEHVFVVLGAKPARPIAHIHMKRLWRHLDRLAKCLARLIGPAQLTKGRRRPTVRDGEW